MTAPTPARAIRRACLGQGTLQCSVWDNPGGRPKCRHCGSTLFEFVGTWGAFDHRGDDRYQLADAHRTFVHLAVAEKWAARREGLVIRWIGQ